MQLRKYHRAVFAGKVIKMCIDKNNVDQLVNNALKSVMHKVENGEPLSSEKTLVFKFMWELCKFMNSDDVKYDKVKCRYELPSDDLAFLFHYHG